MRTKAGTTAMIGLLAMTLCAGAAWAEPAQRGVVAPWGADRVLIDYGSSPGGGGGSRSAGPGLQDAAGHILGQQCGDGGWGWPHASCTPTYNNITGPIALGLLQAYEMTADASHRDAAEAGGVFDLTSRYPAVYQNNNCDADSPRFATFTPYFLWQLTAATGDSTYSNWAEAEFYDELDAGTYGCQSGWDTADFITLIQALRTGTWVNLRSWEFSTLGVTAGAIGTTAQKTLFNQAVLDGLNTLDNTAPATIYADLLGLAGGVRGLALNGTTSFTAIVSTNHSGINGISTLCALAGKLVSYQNGDGSWYHHSDIASPVAGDKDTQTTAYAVMALVAAQDQGCGPYDDEIADGRDWLWSMQEGDGGFKSCPGCSHNTEVEGEVLSAMSCPSEVWVDSAYCEACGNDGHAWGYDAFANIQDGIDAVCGSTVNVANGTYTEQVTITSAMTITGESEAGVIVEGSAGAPASGVNTFTIAAAGQVVTLEKMTIRHGDYGIRSTAGNVNVLHCTLYHNGRTDGGTGVPGSPTQANMLTFWNTYSLDGGAIRIQSSAVSEIAYCTVYENDRGIRFQDSANGDIHDNVSRDNIQAGIYLAASTYTGATGCSDTEVYDNESYNNMNNGLLSIGGIRNTFTNNDVHDNWNSGVMLWHVADNTIQRCTISGNNVYDFNGQGVSVSSDAGGGVCAAGATNDSSATFVFKLLGNTISDNLVGAVGQADGVRVDTPVPSDGIEIKNNSFSGHDIDVHVLSQAATTVVNYNHFLGASSGIENDDTSAIVDGEYNWWGDADGPDDSTGSYEVSVGDCGTVVADMKNALPAGELGKGVSEDVDYCPWWDAPARLTLEPDADCYEATNTVTVELWMRDIAEDIVGGQFFLAYDDSVLSFDTATAESPFLELLEDTSVAGQIDYAVQIPPPTGSVTGDAHMATIRFTALQQICSQTDLITWRSHDPPSRLSDDVGGPVYPVLVDMDVVDDEPPTATQGTINSCYDTAGDANAAALAATTAVTDNCDLAPTKAVQTGAGDCATSIVIRVEDHCGNFTDYTYNTRVDSTDPTASDPTGVTVECIGDVPAADISVVTDEADNCGTPTVAFVSDVTDGLSCPETITRTYSVTDDCLNSINVTQTITVDDTIAPVFDQACPLPAIAVNSDAGTCEAAGSTVSPTTPTATDNCSTPSVDFVRSDGKPNLLDAYEAIHSPITITWTAEDDCLNTATCTQTVTVSAFNEMVVTVELSPTMDDPNPGVPGDTLTRCITFDLWECGGPSSVTVDKEITFSVDDSGPAVGSATLTDVPCGLYECITARDDLHTLRRTLLTPAFAIVGTQYNADFAFAGKDLIGGNLNDDFWIDILDFGVFSSQWAATYGTPGGTTCATAFPHADITGDDFVDTGDFTFIQINFLQGHEPNCCGQPGDGLEEGPITEISVRELRGLGLGHLAVGDLNRDGWLDEADIVEFMQGARPKPVSAKVMRLLPSKPER